MAAWTHASLMQAILLCAVLALSHLGSAGAGKSHYKYTKVDYSYQWTRLSTYVDKDDYKKCSAYTWTKKYPIVDCVTYYKCYDYEEDYCCVDGYKEYKHSCFAKCMGHTTYTPGKCYKSEPKPQQPKKYYKKKHHDDDKKYYKKTKKTYKPKKTVVVKYKGSKGGYKGDDKGGHKGGYKGGYHGHH